MAKKSTKMMNVLSTILLKHALPIRRVPYVDSTLSTFLCNNFALTHSSMVDYTGHFMTGVLHSFLSKTLVLRVQNLKQPIF